MFEIEAEEYVLFYKKTQDFKVTSNTLEGLKRNCSFCSMYVATIKKFVK